MSRYLWMTMVMQKVQIQTPNQGASMVETRNLSLHLVQTKLRMEIVLVCFHQCQLLFAALHLQQISLKSPLCFPGVPQNLCPPLSSVHSSHWVGYRLSLRFSYPVLLLNCHFAACCYHSFLQGSKKRQSYFLLMKNLDQTVVSRKETLYLRMEHLTQPMVFR